MRLLLLALACQLVIAGCKKSDSGNEPGTTAELTVKNVSYGGNALQAMDVYLPANRTAASTRVIVLLHGGAWNQGDKTELDPYVLELKKRFPDYAIFNVNYRLAANNQNLFPTQENDVKAAAQFIYSKRSEYQIGEKWAYIGASAGAHLALLQAYKYNDPVKAKAVVSFYGPTDLTHLYNNPPNPLVSLGLLTVTGTTPALNPTLYAQSSPISFVSSTSPPTLVLQGGADPLVPAVQSSMLIAKLQTAGVPNQYVFYPTAGHGFGDADMLDSYIKVEQFLDLHMQ